MFRELAIKAQEAGNRLVAQAKEQQQKLIEKRGRCLPLKDHGS